MVMDNPRLFLDYLNLKYDSLNKHADVKQVMEREGFQAQFFSCVSDDFLMKPPSQANQEGEVKGHSKTPLTRFPSFLTTLTDIFLEI